MFGGSLEQDRERLKFKRQRRAGRPLPDMDALHAPDLRDIEIGGWVKMSSRLPHPFMLPDLVHRNAAAVLFAPPRRPT